ncbi:ABC transporter substrate-binding protein [Christensenellaceae bacterium OttesenSCG-928-L17]|nr:ABC transporter substrate-binding protein [Christensenellaceae bacterium OttesenSCG-928-L17]
MKKLISVLVMLAMLATVVAGCAGTPAPEDTTTPDVVQPSADPGQPEPDPGATEPIKIGYVSALSGDTALWGQAGLNGMLMTAEKINAAGGVLGRQIEIVGLDGKGEAADSVSAYRKLVEQEGVCAVVGTNFSSCNIPIAAVSDDLKVPVIATAASNELVTVDESGKLHPYSFRLCFIDSFQGTVVGSYAANQLGAKKGALIVDITDAYSTGVGAYIAEAFTAAGGEMVATEEAQSGDNDFRAQLTKIARTEPDVLFIPWIYQNVSLIAKQARELGIECVFLGTDGWDSAELADMAEGALEGCSYVSRIGFNTPEAKAYGEEYVAKYNIGLEAECLFGNDGLMWVIDAIERAGSADPTAIRDALEATDTFTGLLGTMKMDAATHNPQRDCAIFTCTDNEFKFVEIYDSNS